MTAANLSEISDGKLLRSGIIGNSSNIWFWLSVDTSCSVGYASFS
jgi:hypothetical protein